ncbi:MMPL family transporter [Streptomyces sp. NPDC091217]|uniref:MMPL family transporter n=1 Tax=Streptomyces sp. NPDC091217 TaxID=3365975 RepID=UPI00380D270E
MRRGRWLFLVWGLLAVTAALAIPAGLHHTRAMSLQAPGSSSAHAAELIERGFPAIGSRQVILSFDSRTLTADSRPYQDAVGASVKAIGSAPGIGQVMPVPAPPGIDPHHTYLMAGVDRGADTGRLVPVWQDRVQRAAARASSGRVAVAVTGFPPVAAELQRADLADLRMVEAVTLPVALTVLAVGLGSAGSAVVLLATAAFGVLLGAGAVAALGFVLVVDGTSLTAVSTVGVALGLDYSLLVLLRYRRFRQDRDAPHAAARAARASAGRAVLWCAGAVVLTCAGLLTVPLDFVRTVAVAAALAAVAAATVAVTVLPAVLPRLDPLLERGRLRTDRGPSTRAGLGERFTRHLMRHPWPYLLGALAVVTFAAAPAGNLRLGLELDRAAIAHTAAGRGLEQLEGDGLANVTFLALPHRPGAGPVDTTLLADALRSDRRISGFGALDNERDLTVAAVTDRVRADSPASKGLVKDLRATAARMLPPGQQVYSGGPAAALADLRTAAFDAAPPVAALVAAGSLLLMLGAFRSVVLPLKALAMNVLSTAAAFGLLAWTTVHTGQSVNVAVPLLALTVVFGLSLDYEVFLVHRITEHYRAGGDHREAVASGMRDAARPITVAAAVMATVFAGLMATHRQDFQQMGFLVATAVLLDATLIRLVVVPALMRLLGHRNWWMPRFLHRLVPPVATHSVLPSQRPTGPAAPVTETAASRRQGHRS